MLFTDAAAKTGIFAAILRNGGSRTADSALYRTTDVVPHAWPSLFLCKNKIYETEILSPLAFVWFHASIIRNSSINLYMGSNNCIASLARGDTPGDFLAGAVAEFRRICRLLSIDIWIGRVRSKLNIADLPTKKAKLPLRVGKTEAFPNLLPLMPQCVKFTQKQPSRRIGIPGKFPIESFFTHSR